MANGSARGSRASDPATAPETDKGDGGSPPKLRGLDSNPQGAFGPQFWQGFRAHLAHLYTLSLPDPSEEARFTLATRTYATPRGILTRCQGTAFIMTRGPALTAQSPDQLLILLQTEGSVDTDYGGRHARREVGDVEIVDYARPFRSAATDYANLIVTLARDSVPATLLALEPHGLIFQRGSGAARLIGAALQEFYAQADDLTVSEAEAAIEGIVALTTACARARLAADEAHHVKSRRKAALDYIDAHFADAQLGPDDVAAAANVSRASLYRLLVAEGGIRAVLLKRRLDEALRLMLADNRAERSQAVHARFGLPPRQYLALVRQQDIDWHEARYIADGFDRDSFLWRQQRSNGSRQPSGGPE
jgi:AraC-like DNA-binding protein